MMPAEPGLVISSGRPRVPGSSAVSSSGERMFCDSSAEEYLPAPSNERQRPMSPRNVRSIYSTTHTQNGTNGTNGTNSAGYW